MFQKPFERKIPMRSEEIRRKMIETTKDLLKRQAQVTVKDIADQCYVNIAAVNYHFGSKEQLLSIVIEEVLEDLKTFITNEIIENAPNVSIDFLLERLMSYIYNFSLENLGVLSYLFLTREFQGESSNLLVEMFFKDNDFTRLIYQSLQTNMHISNPKETLAKYMILFSSFSIPIFIQITQSKSNKINIDTFKDPEFRQFYINNIIKLAQVK
jgi:AcrR family transcriptional regulator